MPYTPDIVPLELIDLASELEGMKSPELKLQLTTYAPGSAGAMHDHRGHPEAVYVLDGAITDHRGGAVRVYRQGETYKLEKGATHRMQNDGDVPAKLLVAMVWDRE